MEFPVPTRPNRWRRKRQNRVSHKHPTLEFRSEIAMHGFTINLLLASDAMGLCGFVDVHCLTGSMS